MGRFLRGIWYRIRRYYSDIRFEPTGTELDALSPEECDAIVEQNRRRWRRRQIKKAIDRRLPREPE